MVTIVGVGPGNIMLVTPYAIEKISKADLLVGGKRHLDEFFYIKCEKIAIDSKIDYSKILKHSGNIVILASGDPFLYGIAEVILRYIDKDQVEVVPGISSVQYLCSQLKISFEDLKVVSLHGKDYDIIKVLKENKKVAVFTDNVHTPQFIAKTLLNNNYTFVNIHIGENLSYENEKIYLYNVKELANERKEFELNTVVITCGDI
ncbi:MAG: precorrin-6y C5,15-methyltransferase (decarboxylating) subunit CbiE [Thermoanaerobacteraceae bacterium]